MSEDRTAAEFWPSPNSRIAQLGHAGSGQLTKFVKQFTVAQALRRFTTTELTAGEIHAIGLCEVARIEQQTDKLLRRLGYTRGTIKDR